MCNSNEPMVLRTQFNKFERNGLETPREGDMPDLYKLYSKFAALKSMKGQSSSEVARVFKNHYRAIHMTESV